MLDVIDRTRNVKTAGSKEAFEKAIKYLKLSDLARFIIKQFEDSSSTTVVKVEVPPNRGGGNSWDPPAWKRGDLGGTVWWQASRTEIDYTRFGSAAMALMHELGHAYQYLSEKKRVKDIIKPKLAAIFPRVRRRVAGSANFLDNLELTNTQAIELTVAHEINKELVFARGPKYQWLEPVRELYQDRGIQVKKTAPTPEQIKEYVTQLRKERRSPPPIFKPIKYNPKTSNYLTLIEV
jgi:hypothetical protein